MAVGVIVGALLGHKLGERKVRAAEEETLRLVDDAKRKADEIVKQAEDESTKRTAERERKFDRDLQKRRVEIERIESRVKRREDHIDQREEQLSRREQSLTDKDRRAESRLEEIEKSKKDFDSLKNNLIAKCEQVSGLSAEQAKKLLLDQLDTELRQEQAAAIRRVEAETRELAEKKSRQILTLAMQKCATEQVTESTVSVVHLPNDEMKGRIIGREGRNIRTLEQLTGVNIIVDDTPEAVVISCFDPLRREVARLTLDKLIADGRIHPARVEELVEKCERELQESVRQAGESACAELGLYNIHPELVKLLGRLKYRTSYGQNVLRHVVECAHLAGVLAAELGIDPTMAKRAALLHDIGKAVSSEMEGTHTSIGADLARKYDESPAVIHAIEAHHGEVEPRTLVAVIVQTADAVSASRRGSAARKPSNRISNVSRPWKPSLIPSKVSRNPMPYKLDVKSESSSNPINSMTTNAPNSPATSPPNVSRPNFNTPGRSRSWFCEKPGVSNTPDKRLNARVFAASNPSLPRSTSLKPPVPA